LQRHHETVEVVRTGRRLWITTAATFLVAALWQFLTYNGFPNDHYFHVARARQMLLGEWPVRDFVDPGAPLQYVISAASRWLFGDIAAAELVVVAFGVAVGAAATVVCASWLARSVVVAAGVALLEVLASPRSYSYPKMVLYGLAGCLIVAIAERGSRARLVLAGVLTAAAFLMRHDHGLFIGVACAAAIVLSAPGVRDAARRFGLFAAVVAVLLAPWAAWVQYYQGLVPYFQMGITVSRREADISLLRDLPQLQFSAGLTPDNLQAWLYYLFWILPPVCVLLALWRRVTRREQWSGEWVAICAIAVMAVALDATFLRNPLATRLADATVPAALLGAWLIGLAWSMKSPLAIALSARTATAVVLVCTLVAIWGLGDVTGKLDDVGVFEDDLEHLQEHTAATVAALTMPEVDLRKHPSRVSAALVPFLRYVSRCTETTDRMLVSGPYPEIFVYARRGFAGGHIAFLEAIYHSDADQELTLKRMERESVPFVVLPLDNQDAFAGSFPKVLAHVTAAYDVLADISADGLKGIRIMVERARTRTGTDSETGWPCFVQAGVGAL
jgi:hypothetical protein